MKPRFEKMERNTRELAALPLPKPRFRRSIQPSIVHAIRAGASTTSAAEDADSLLQPSTAGTAQAQARQQPKPKATTVASNLNMMTSQQQIHSVILLNNDSGPMANYKSRHNAGEDAQHGEAQRHKEPDLADCGSGSAVL